MTDKTHSWSDLANLTHATQVAEFGFCPCEDDQPIYADCPKARDTYTMTFFYTVAVQADDAEDAEAKGWGVFKTNLDAGAITVGDFVASDPEQVEM